MRLFKHVAVFFSVLEKNFLSAKGGGVQSNRMIFTDSTYCDLEHYDDYYRPDDADVTVTLNPETAKKSVTP